MRLFHTLRFRLVGAFLLVGLAPLIAVTSVNGTYTYSHLSDLANESVATYAQGSRTQVDEYLTAVVADVQVVATIPSVRYAALHPKDKAASFDAWKALLAMADRTSDYYALTLIGIDGVAVATTNPLADSEEGADLRGQPYFRQAVRKQTFLGDSAFGRSAAQAGQGHVILIAVPIIEGEKVIAVLRLRLGLSGLFSLVERAEGRLGAGSHALLLDEFGIRLANSETVEKGRTTPGLLGTAITSLDDSFKDVTIDAFPAAQQAISKGSNRAFTYLSPTGESRLGYVVKLTTQRWQYVLTLPLSTYTGIQDRAVDAAVAQAGVAVALIIILALALAHRLAARIRKISAKAVAVSLGEIDPDDAEFDTRGDDVVRAVAEAFERMVLALRFYKHAHDVDGAAEVEDAGPVA